MEQMLMRGNELRAQALWNQWWDIFDPMLKNGGHQRAFNKQLIHLGGQIQAVSSPERSKNKQTSFPFLSWQLGQHVFFESIKKTKKPPEVMRSHAYAHWIYVLRTLYWNSKGSVPTVTLTSGMLLDDKCCGKGGKWREQNKKYQTRINTVRFYTA